MTETSIHYNLTAQHDVKLLGVAEAKQKPSTDVRNDVKQTINQPKQRGNVQDTYQNVKGLKRLSLCRGKWPDSICN